MAEANFYDSMLSVLKNDIQIERLQWSDVIKPSIVLQRDVAQVRGKKVRLFEPSELVYNLTQFLWPGFLEGEWCVNINDVRRNTFCLRRLFSPTHDAWHRSNSGCGPRAIAEDALVRCSSAFKEKLLRERRAEIYPMKERSPYRTRLALLINNIEFRYEDDRVGAEQDELRLQRLLKGLGYTVLTLRNLTAWEMHAALRDFSRRREHFQSDSCFVVLMSHGNADGICGVSSSAVNEDIFSTDEIYNCLNTVNCPGLRDKPKIILIQSCRGDEDGCVEEKDNMPKKHNMPKKVHREKDFCCLRSCTPDTVSYRNPQRGSVFIREIEEIFNKHAHEDHIEELFRKVLGQFSKNHPEQMPCKDRTTLSKLFYLFPGL